MTASSAHLIHRYGFGVRFVYPLGECSLDFVFGQAVGATAAKAIVQTFGTPVTRNERAWFEFIRIISCGSDPKVAPARMRSLREALDMRPEGARRAAAEARTEDGDCFRRFDPADEEGRSCSCRSTDAVGRAGCTTSM